MLRNAIYLLLIRFVFVITAMISPFCAQASTTSPAPVTEGASEAKTPENPKNDLLIRFGNESNQNDGLLGPFTYGFRFAHELIPHYSLEVGYMRLHEPNTPSLHSVLDEGQISLKKTDIQWEGQNLEAELTYWKNRMIDLYTSLGGLTLNWKREVISINLGLFAGNANREELSSGFIGGMVGLGATIGPVELAVSTLNGRMETGYYRKSGIDGSVGIGTLGGLPISLTFAVEDRFFQFGQSGFHSDASDELIYISGIEFQLNSVLFKNQ